MEIVPAVIVKSFRELEFKAQFVKDVLSQIEIDVCDGGKECRGRRIGAG
jgi:hypothetical protein